MHPEPRSASAGRWGRRLALLFAALLAAAVVAGPAAAAGPPVKAARLGEAERAEIARIEQYLNGLATVEARFLQASSTGEYAEGRLYIARPGRLRIEYDPPVPILIVANRGLLNYYDKSLEQVSHMPVDSTPAGLLVRDKIALLSDELVVTGFVQEAQAVRLTLVRGSDPLEGSITLVFAEKPLELKKWAVVDAQGVTTTVSLMAARYGVTLDPQLFEFRDPTAFKPTEH